MISRRNEDFIYICLAGVFIAALVTCNLIANKFVSIDLGFKTFIVSAGIKNIQYHCDYPIISEAPL